MGPEVKEGLRTRYASLMAKEKKPETRQGPRGGKTTVTKGGLIRTVIYLDPEERRALKLAAVERDCPASEVARQALREHLGLDRR